MNTRSLDLGSVDLRSTVVEHFRQRSTAVLLGIGVLRCLKCSTTVERKSTDPRSRLRVFMLNFLP